MKYPLVVVIGTVLGCKTAAPPSAPQLPERTAPPEFLSSPHSAALGLPFSEAVRAGGLLFLSGQIGNVPGTRTLVLGGIGPESRQVMDNIKATLAHHGAALDDVIKCTVFLTDMSEWPAFNEIYASYFSKHFPARSALGANGLALGARIEVECIAYVAAAR